MPDPARWIRPRHQVRHRRVRSQAGPRLLWVSGGRKPLRRKRSSAIVNHMVQYRPMGLDASFAALSDATRRGVLEHLGRNDASISELADRFHMTPTGMSKHIGVLEQAGLVVTAKVGRVRTCRIGARRLDEVEAWIDRYHQRWDERFRELDQIIDELQHKETEDGSNRTS